MKSYTFFSISATVILSCQKLIDNLLHIKASFIQFRKFNHFDKLGFSFSKLNFSIKFFDSKFIASCQTITSHHEIVKTQIVTKAQTIF